jgi:NADH-quinone oxidoreductase subunit G
VQALNKFQQEIGGQLTGGDPGKLLIEPGTTRPRPYFSSVFDASEPNMEEQRIMPLHRIFGSEELSGYSPSIAERTKLGDPREQDTP